MSTTPEMIETRRQFGSHLKDIRKAQELTQAQLGAIIGLDRSYISRLEHGCCNVTLDTIVLLADGLDIDPAELLSGITLKPSTNHEPLALTLGLTRKQSRCYHITKI